MNEDLMGPRPESATDGQPENDIFANLLHETWAKSIHEIHNIDPGELRCIESKRCVF
jgi:hypothetical protein